MDPSKGHSVPDTGISFLGSLSHKSICHEAEQSTSDFHFSLPRPVSMAVDATSLSWEGMIAYAFPPIPLLMKVLLKMEKETCLIILTAPCWESHPFFPVLLSDCCTSSQTSNSEGSFDPASIRYSSSEAGNLQPVRLAMLQGGFEKAGFSKTSSKRVCAAMRASTQSLYNYRWNTWMEWCLQRQMDPIDPSVMTVADFLIFPFE